MELLFRKGTTATGSAPAWITCRQGREHLNQPIVGKIAGQSSPGDHISKGLLHIAAAAHQPRGRRLKLRRSLETEMNKTFLLSNPHENKAIIHIKIINRVDRGYNVSAAAEWTRHGRGRVTPPRFSLGTRTWHINTIICAAEVPFPPHDLLSVNMKVQFVQKHANRARRMLPCPPAQPDA